MSKTEMTVERAIALAAERAVRPETSGLYWLRDDDGHDADENYCHICVRAAPLLPQLVVCHLLQLIGVDVMAPQPHEWLPKDSDSQTWQKCRHCKWKKTCRSWPERALDLVKDAEDGGWADESDSFRSCDFCGMELDVNLTDYAANSELDHWEENGPPAAGRGWWEFAEMLDVFGREDQRWPRVFALLDKWGLS